MPNNKFNIIRQPTNRRKFIGGLVGAIAAPNVLSQDNDQIEYDTIVIGGGFAGVSASRDLS